MKHQYITPKDVSSLLKIPVGVLAQWRCRGDGPPFYKVGGKHVRYAVAEVEQWLEENARCSTRSAKPRNGLRGKGGLV